MINYDEFLEDINDNLKVYTIYNGYIDIYYNAETNTYRIKDTDDDFFYMIFGRCEVESAREQFTDMDYDVDKEGCYTFEAIFRYCEEETYEGRCTVPSYHYIEHIRLTYDHSFISRERESKLNEMFEDFF